MEAAGHELSDRSVPRRRARACGRDESRSGLLDADGLSAVSGASASRRAHEHLLFRTEPWNADSPACPLRIESGDGSPPRASSETHEPHEPLPPNTRFRDALLAAYSLTDPPETPFVGTGIEEAPNQASHHLMVLVASRSRFRSSVRPPAADRKNSRGVSGCRASSPVRSYSSAVAELVPKEPKDSSLHDSLRLGDRVHSARSG